MNDDWLIKEMVNDPKFRRRVEWRIAFKIAWIVALPVLTAGIGLAVGVYLETR